MNDRIEQIKRDNPIVEYLATRGIFHVRQSGVDFYYLSPLPEHQGEKSPSFHVNSRKNVWYDFALGIGGDIINLHEKLTGSREGLSSTFIHNNHTQKAFHPINENNENKIKIDKVGMLRNNNLLNYMAERGISSEVTKKFCEEVHYTVKSKQYYAVGFITDNDGYVLRNKYSKIFYNPQPNKPNNKLTTIGGRAQNGKCLVFEGFCDFLAYMELERKGDTVVKSIGEVERAYILNSTNTLNNTDVVTEITQHKEVFGFFDNDKTGCEAAQKLMHELNRAGGTYHHAMPYSPEYNDLNDYLCYKNNKRVEKNIAEMDEIKKLAIVHGNFMTAPDGSHSDMTEEQWCFSRTRAFKKLIGDWEKAAQIKKLRASTDLEITGKEIQTSDDIKQYKKNALEYSKKLRGIYKNSDTRKEILISRQSLDEILRHDGGSEAHIQSVSAIPLIIENSIYIDTAKNEDKIKNPSIMDYDYYVIGLKINDIDYTVKAVIANDNNGNRYYDHKLTQIDKIKLLDLIDQAVSKSALSGLSSTTASGIMSNEKSGNQDTENITSIPAFENKDRRLISILQVFTKIKENLITDKGEPAGFIVNRIKTLLEKGFVEDLDYAIGGIELSETQKRTIILGGEVLLKNVRNSKDEKKNLLIKYDAKKCDFVHRETIENKTETQKKLKQISFGR